MSCGCSRAKNIPNCFTTLVIGDVVEPTIAYYAYFRTPDGRVDRYATVDVVYTDIVGVENIDVRIGTQYEVWITKQTALNANERVAFIPAGQLDSVECVYLEFDYCDSSFTTQTITLA